MSNSSLVNYTRISPNKTLNRNHTIDTLTIHCVVGQLSVEKLGQVFASPSRNASSNYGVGPDGRIGMYVEEKDRSWATSNRANDMRAITIEVASDTTAPYAVTAAAYESLIKLVVDICKRNGIKSLKWQGNKALIGKVDKQNMSVHRWFANKACPGGYLYDKMGIIASEVNAALGVEAVKVEPSQPISGKEVALKVEITTDLLNIRTGPGTSYAQVGTVKKGTICSIVELSKGWGKLEDGRGWISLSAKYSKTVKETQQQAPAQTSTPAPSLPEYKVGQMYTLLDEMNVRTGPGTNYSKKNHYQLTNDAKKHDADKDGALDKGTRVTCKEIKQVDGNQVWMRCPSGWIAAYYKGSVNVK